MKQAVENILNSSKLKFQTESFIYTFTNENIKGYLPYFKLENQDILTVTGSGDPVLNLLLSVDSLDTFDINLYAYYLKKTPMFLNNKADSMLENIERNMYLEEQNYYKLKRKILDQTVIFHHANIKSLQLDKQFDFILISNITDYLHNMFSFDILRNYKKFIYSRITPMLKVGGKLVSYLYDGEMKGFSKKQVATILNFNFEQKSVGQDKILIFQNQK